MSNKSGRGGASNATPSYMYMYVAPTAGGQNDEVEEIAMPKFGEEVEYDIAPAPAELRDLVVKKFEVLFSTVPGSTKVAYDTMPTSTQESTSSLQDSSSAEMLDCNIIRVSSSPWLAPAIYMLYMYVPKKSGEIRISIDYRELNKQTVKDVYPLKLRDKIQDRLSGSKVFWLLAIASKGGGLHEDCLLSWSWYGSI